MGTLYITYLNSIGISFENATSDLIKETLEKAILENKVLPEIKSKRGKHFHVNANPKDKKLIIALEKMGMRHIQSTFEYRN